MRKKAFQFLYLGLFIALFVSCDTNRIFEEYYPINSGSWHKDSLVVFNIPINDTLQNNNLFINIRNDINYGYSNIWLFVNIQQPDGMAVKDTFEMVLAEPSGKWLGQGFGGLKTRQAMYRNNVYFPNSGEYKISIQHGMRNPILEGIRDVGFRVEKVD